MVDADRALALRAEPVPRLGAPRFDHGESVERLRIMAKQKLPSEMDDEQLDSADWQGGYEYMCVEARAVFAATPSQFGHGAGYAMDSAPKDCAVLAWCSPECGDPECGYSREYTGKSTRLCLYHVHAEGLSAYGLGFCIVEWGGGWDDSTWESPNQGWMPDWWFRFGSEFEEVANPVRWWPLPAIVDTRPKDGDAKQAPLASSAAIAQKGDA